MNEKKKKILLVEDDEMLVNMYSDKFRREGYDVETAMNGADGLKAASSYRPDIILLDIVMPKMDGFAVLKKLKKKMDTKDIPVLLLTNLGQEEDVKKGKELGAADYYIKANHTPAQIVLKVKEVLE